MATLDANTSPALDKESNANGAEDGNGHRHRHRHVRNDFSPPPHALAAADGGTFNPGLWKPYEHRKFANPAPLGLCAFAGTTFVLSCINMGARGITAPNIVVPLAFAYGGLVQLLAGMWEMACGNTFGATAFSSYGGFWIAYGILLTPNWNILGANGPYEGHTGGAMGLFLTGWFIFTTILLLCVLKSTYTFLFLFFVLDLAFLCLLTEQYALDNGSLVAGRRLQQAAGAFSALASFMAWYHALAGLQDKSNSFFMLPELHLPWSETGMELRRKSDQADV